MGCNIFLNPPGDQKILLFSWWITPPGDQEIFSWWVLHFFLIHQESKKFFCPPGGLIHQETRRFSPGGVQYFSKSTRRPRDSFILLVDYSTKRLENLLLVGTTLFFNPPGDQEILLVSWWINSPGDQEIFSWWSSTHLLINQETKKFSCPPGGSIHQETRRFSPGGVPYFFNPPGDQEILLVSWWGAIFF